MSSTTAQVLPLAIHHLRAERSRARTACGLPAGPCPCFISPSRRHFAFSIIALALPT